MSRYKWEPTFDEENGWMIRKLVHNSIPESTHESYDDEDEAQELADELNRRDKADREEGLKEFEIQRQIDVMRGKP